MFESNQTLVPEVLPYCKTLFMQHTYLLLGPATLWKELGMSVIISFFIFIICMLKRTFYCKYHLRRTHHTLTKDLFVEYGFSNLAACKGFGSVLMYTYNFIFSHLWTAFAQVIAMVLQLAFSKWSYFETRNKGMCIIISFLYVYAIHFDYQSKMCTIQFMDNVHDVYFYSLCLHQSNIVKKYSLQDLQRK
jgi:hypothetical protein